MKIELKNIGIFKRAEYELGDITIICGENNTGKTYATYSLYGFFDFWNNVYSIPVEDLVIDSLIEKGTCEIPLETNIDKLNKILKEACKEYSQMLPRVLASQEKYFSDSYFEIKVTESDLNFLENYDRTWKSGKSDFIHITMTSNSKKLSISLMIPSVEIINLSLRMNLKNAIASAIKEILFSKIITNIFISSAERTGAAFFKNDLNIDQNALIKEAVNSYEINITEIVRKIYTSPYALPVRNNINYIRKLDEVVNTNSFVSKEYPEIIDSFYEIAGGSYRVNREGLYFIPHKSKLRLNIGEGSSSVRSLLDLNFYLNYSAQKGDILMIDEPELNLHPSNQRKLAKLFVSLTKIGIKVFITTHSDYILREFNTLIMMKGKKDKQDIKALMKKYKYSESDLIDARKFKVYVSQKSLILLDGNKKKTKEQNLVCAPIDEEYGIDVQSFDATIEEMNKIQEKIIFGG
ncbi:AAA family ATPase [bacterium]|nr:AAA family ATPase [bacterium]